MMFALDSDALGLAYARGMVASVNPCGFVLLPTYLLYFLGVEASGTSTDQRASVRRALLVGASVSTGFVTVFLVIGSIAEFIDRWVIRNSKYATGVIGLVFVALGIAILAGYRPRFATPHLDAGGRTRSVGSMFVYGVAYAVASLGCTMPLFLPAVFGAGRREGIATGVSSAALYGFGMSLVVVALTVSLALANQLLLRVLRAAMRYVDLLAAAFLLLSGLYLLYYFVVVDVQGNRSSITDSLDRWQRRLSADLSSNWEVAAVVLTVVVAAAVVYVARRNGTRAASAPPEAG
jgi:cytochrome c-type biogenesis protein